MAKKEVFGYLPNDRPPFGSMIVLGLQHVLAMFPATVLVATIVGFNVGAVLAVSGLATITALILSKLIAGKFIPLYYGSSFAYIAATLAIMGGDYGGINPVRIAQVGIVSTGVVNILVGLVIHFAGGRKVIDKVLPPIITGSVALTIGIALAGAALNDAFGVFVPDIAGKTIIIAAFTLLVTILFSVYLQGRGFIGLIPILLGMISGYVFAILLGVVDFSAIKAAPWFEVPGFTLPYFRNFGSSGALQAIFGIAIICIATIPESTAHLYQMSLYVDNLAENMGKERYNLRELIGLNLILDGLGDSINGMFGGVAGTNYGENNSLMVITRNYSGPALITAGVIAIVIAFVGKLTGFVQSIPTGVIGGLEIYLFGIIGMQGIAIIQSEKVNLYDPRNLAIGAVILVVGIGGNIQFGDLPIPVLQGMFPTGLPSIATAAVLGIFLNVIFMIVKAPEDAMLEAEL